MVARTWSSSRLSCGERLLLRCHGNAGNSFLTTQGKEPSSRSRRRKGGSSECGRDSRASSRVEIGMSGNFLSCSKGVKDPLEVQGVRCDKPQDASSEMGLISPEGENLLDFLQFVAGAIELRQGPQGPALVASGKASRHASCSGASRDSSPVDAGA